MIYKIEEIPTTRIAYMRQVGPYGANNYALMDKFKAWVKSKGLFSNATVILGIPHDNPKTTLPENCRYDVCLVITGDYIIADSNIGEAELPGGKYAVFPIVHTAQAVQKAWTEIFSLLTAQGHQFDVSKPILERYSFDMTDKQMCEICVPIQETPCDDAP